MRSFVLAAILSAFCLGSSAQAGTWMFQRSYYSHQPPQSVRIGPRSQGGPFYAREQGVFVRSGYRRIYSAIVIPGQTVDQLNYVESWIQNGAQF